MAQELTQHLHSSRIGGRELQWLHQWMAQSKRSTGKENNKNIRFTIFWGVGGMNIYIDTMHIYIYDISGEVRNLGWGKIKRQY